MRQDRYYDVWWREGDQSMEDSHLKHWKWILEHIPETDLQACSVLDFGCNQGGFLRLLYEQRPFKEAVGTDLARQSIEVANQRKGSLPISYEVTSDPDQWESRFDLAFSLAVLYLLDDLGEHARKMKACLKPGGVYYATYADYPNNPSFPLIRQNINQNSALPLQEHSLDAIADAFFKEGFQVEIRRMIPSGFVALSPDKSWYQCIADKLLYTYEQAYIFRLIAPAAR
ncbi:class I SAM-dependent methyltransferase [Xylanibacillus composti]|uniref:Class I SAM-dependent methyltransferase n=1 Tax=Xylanibacillus composti TaxID=1572762 RepID=A0A8J4H2P8_9BACL|nr:class I SAM-dependent methyltransferase [Xylanibacillus composti]MDT9723582.1 class I SAM-dependent methyltransferase [Xylanibacillus composti]GIQ68381.1 hypothetical protein XYCOK13_12050 [Xylanibacillus composti]